MGTWQRCGLWRSRWAAIGAAIAVAVGAGGIITVSAATEPSAFVAITPHRVLDTRTGLGLAGMFTSGIGRTVDVTGSISARRPDGTIGSTVVVPDGATALVANITAVSSTSSGYVAVRPGSSAGTPTTANLSIPAANTTIANSVTVELVVNGTIQIYFGGKPGSTSHLILDIVGYYEKGRSQTRQVQVEAWSVLPRASTERITLFSDGVLSVFGDCSGSTMATPTAQIWIQGIAPNQGAGFQMGYAIQTTSTGGTATIYQSGLDATAQSPWGTSTQLLDGVVTTGLTHDGGYRLWIAVLRDAQGRCNFRGMVNPEVA